MTMLAMTNYWDKTLSHVMRMVNFLLLISCHCMLYLKFYTSYIISYLSNSIKLRKKDVVFRGVLQFDHGQSEKSMLWNVSWHETFKTKWSLLFLKSLRLKNFFSIYARSKIVSLIDGILWYLHPWFEFCQF